MADNSPQPALLYGLNDRPAPVRTVLYALQWVGFTLTQIVVVPIVLGPYLGLDAAGTAELAQRVFFFVGLGSLLQVLVGHRLPIVEGTAGMWWGLFIGLGSMAAATGKPLATLRTDLELAMMAAGAVTLLLGATGVIARIQGIFTPAVTGTAMVLLSIELSSTVVPKMLGLGFPGEAVQLPAAAVGVLTVACVAAVSLFAPRYLRSFGMLIGMTVGWIAFAVWGFMAKDAPWAASAAASALDTGPVRALGFPWPLAWGAPTYDPGVVLVCFLTALLLTAQQIAAIHVMEDAVRGTPHPATLNRSLVVTGLINILCGSGASLGLSSFASAAAVVNLSGVAARVPFVLHALLMMAMGLVPALALALTHLPEPVANAVLLVAAFQLFLIGVRQFAAMALSQRDTFVVGAAVLGGTGVMFVPDAALAPLPSVLQYIVGSGMMTGMIIALLVERLLPEPGKSR
ncbi:MAG TPA: purine/pyrimidine permease [Limnochordales bacterium]